MTILRRSLKDLHNEFFGKFNFFEMVIKSLSEKNRYDKKAFLLKNNDKFGFLVKNLMEIKFLNMNFSLENKLWMQ